MTTVYLALGSNVGDSLAYIKTAIQLLKEQVIVQKQATILRSKAVGITDQPDFLNTAVMGVTELEPAALLQFVKEVEQRIGRIFRFRWGPREIDIDIILYDSQIVQSERLTIPHPRFTERDFVLIPLVELNPNIVDPVSHKSVTELLAALPRENRAVI